MWDRCLYQICLNLWKIKGDKPVINGYIAIVNKSNPNPNKLQPDQGSKFYNKHMPVWLDINDTLKPKFYRQCQLMIVNLI